MHFSCNCDRQPLYMGIALWATYIRPVLLGGLALALPCRSRW